MKYFVIADVHGFYEEMLEALNQKGFDQRNSNHQIILLGDAFDRGPGNLEVYTFLKEMLEQKKLIYIRGNHEDLLDSAIYRRCLSATDFRNHTQETVWAFARAQNPYTDTESLVIPCEDAYRFGITQFLSDYTVNYYETEHYIFVHGFFPVIYDDMGFPKYRVDWREADYREWCEARWINGMEMAMLWKIKEAGKTIVVGHWSASYGNVRKNYDFDRTSLSVFNEKQYEFDKLEYTDKENFRPFIGDGIIGLDACTVFTGFVNCLVLED